MSESVQGGFPDDWDEMDREEREAWAEEREQELHEAADSEARLSESEQDALAALGEAVESDTETVELRDGVEVQVKTHISADIEDNLEHINRNRRDLQEVRGALCETMAWVVEDEDYGSEAVWRLYAEKYGVARLSEMFYRVMEPALDRAENSEAVQQFRADEQGTSPVSSRRGHGPDA